MKTWRVLGLVWAVLSLGQLAACGGGGGGTKPDADKGRPDGGADVDDEDGGGDDDPETGSDDLDASVDADSGCQPKSCSDFGYECGSVDDDGCGGTLDCGKCKGTNSCGGGGEPHLCGCTPKTCEQLSSEHGVKICGTIANGCDRDIKCGGDEVCGANSTCGGGGTDNECGCTPDPAPCTGKECGSASNGCGLTVQCGASAGACSDSRECNTQQACTCKVDNTAFCADKCGAQQTPDGCSVQCAPCTHPCADTNPGAACSSCDCDKGDSSTTGDDQVCLSGMCCLPEAHATTCAVGQCGTKQNNCGQAVDCGGCASGSVCFANQCKDPVAEMIGTYGVRSTGFGVASGVTTRAEGLLLVDIYKDPSSGKVLMKEQSCWSVAYSKPSGNGMTPEPTTPITEVGPASSGNLVPTVIELDLSNSQSLPGAHGWVRGVQPSDQNTSGWRRGWPSFCPQGSGAPSASLPGYGPAGGGDRALGALKPWLAGAACRCPAEEVAAHGSGALCNGKTGADLTACIVAWAQSELPYQPGLKPSNSSDVTDCRVVDDDRDTKPGVTAPVAVALLDASATLRSASVFANVFWGEVDLSGAKAHWGVSQDQAGLKSANVACENTSGLGANLLCGTSSGDLCGAYSGTKTAKAQRINPVDFVSLQGKIPTGGGTWTCQSLYDSKGTLFSPVAWTAAAYTNATANNNCKAAGTPSP